MIDEVDNKKVKKKKGKKKILIILLILIIVLSGLFVYYQFFSKHGIDEEDARVINKIELYDYYIYENASNYYKDEFNVLKKMSKDKDLSNDDLAKQVAKLYVIDLFSINDKINKYEVTSSQYFYSKVQKMHTSKVIDTLYNYVEDNYNGDRKQELPEVTDVEIVNLKNDVYMKGDKEKESWVVELKITYAKDLGYDKHSQVTMITEGDNMSVVNYKAL